MRLEGTGNFQGSAYVYFDLDNGGPENATLAASDGAEGNAFAGSVSMSGNTALVGALAEI